MKYRENYWSWMCQNINFARYDRQFIQRVYNQRIARNRAVTPKQADLWEILVYRYRRQISEANIDPNDILAAPWQMVPQPVPPDHEQYQLALRDNNLIMRSPYNADQVDAWRKFRASRGIYDEVWDPDAREWIIPLTATNLKHTLNFCSREKQPFAISAEVLDLLDPVLANSQADQWTVQARLVNGRIMINCINQHLLQVLPDDMPLTLSTLNTLTRAGIEVHPELLAVFMQDPDNMALVMLSSQQSTALAWSQQNHEAILAYIEQQKQDNIILELHDNDGAYYELCQSILRRWPSRARTYQRMKSRDPNWEFISDQYDYQDIDFDQVDIAINKSRNLVVWDPGTLPAQIARKNIYYIDPQHDREDYLDGNNLW